jgi:ATP-dependent exoDNAse (exonuclease V) alpha subunit
MLSREWLYTAMTRSSLYCTVIAENKALRRAISNTSVQNKQTFLKELIEE